MVYPTITFILVFLFHMIYSVWKVSRIQGQWVQVANQSVWSLYFEKQDFLIGFSYALAGAFAVFAFLRLLKNRKSALGGVVGGLSLMSAIYLGVCFLLGCCGSPMLAVYLGLFGSSFLGLTKILVALITTVSVVIGYFWLKKSSGCCTENQSVCGKTDN